MGGVKMDRWKPTDWKVKEEKEGNNVDNGYDDGVNGELALIRLLL